MKKLLTLLLFLSTISFINAQILTPVKWESAVEKVNDTTYNLIYRGDLQSGWHLYSQHLPEDGALPTEFIYDEKQLGETFNLLKKDAAEAKTITHFDNVFEMDLTYFEDEAIFVHRILLKDKAVTKIIGEIAFQVCNDESCLFDSNKLTFNLETAKQVSETDDSYAKLTTKPAKLSGLKLDLGAVNMETTQIFTPVKWEVQIEKLSDTEFDLLYTATIEKDWHIYAIDALEDGPISTSVTFLNTRKEYELQGKLREGKGHIAFEELFDKDIKYFEGVAIFRQKIKTNVDSGTINSELEYMACSNGQCLPPEIVKFNFEFKNGNLTQTGKISSELNKEDTIDDKEEKDDKSMLTLFILSFLGGLTALFTPCVFPMIPMTVSFFTKQSKTKAAGIKNAVIYGLAIIILYVLLGVVVSAVFGADKLNELSTDPWFNLIFFVLLIVFAVSFLGAFEIMLPNSWANKVDRQADRGGMIGIFFMALALAIVSFSCTGPIVGSALVAAATTGSYVAPILSMLGFSLAIALPFALFAAFPGWLNSLPKSGGWLNTVKVVLGFLELALAFKFLSMADIAWDLHLIERETFIAIWIAIFGALAMYLFGKIQLPHDSPLTHISVGRLLLGLMSLTFVVYLIPGLWGAPLKIISGLPPDMNYSESPYGVGYKKESSGSVSEHKVLPKGAHFLKPYDIVSFHDYKTGLAYAKQEGKPVLIDFTGKNCVNCRKMEERIWPEEQVLGLLKNEIVLISLYVDSKEVLPKSEQYVSKETGKEIVTVGNKWSDFQIKIYKANAQPFYVLIDHNEKNLNKPVGYTPDVLEYSAWLQDGIANFKK